MWVNYSKWYRIGINNDLIVVEENDKIIKKELLLSKRKDKKDKKERGYAALEGESSADESYDTK